MRINIYAHVIFIEILDEMYARAQNWSSVEYYTLRTAVSLLEISHAYCMY
jgi:hypothetical protein